MEVTAKTKYLRVAPRKVRLVIDLVRGLDVTPAREQLRFVNKAAMTPVIKAIDSAIANAEHNFKLDRHNLYVKKITADQGPTLKRWLPRAFGRATQILKRTTHLTVVLAERVPTKPLAIKPLPAEKPTTLTTAPAPKRDVGAEKIIPTKETVAPEEKVNHQAEPFDVRRLGGQERDTGHQDKRQLSVKKGLRKIFNRKSG